MTEVGEIIGVAVGHDTSNKECPFCPEEEIPDFTTKAGLDNDGTTLGKNMNDPDGFASTREKECRPKKKEDFYQDPPSKKRKKELKEPTPICTHPDVGDISCEAHHLISGKQALAKNNEHDFEKWIQASQKNLIEKDTGYSVNNYDNGLWMPSVPEDTIGKAGAWGKLDRQAVANWVMEETDIQFHKGGHSIPEKLEINGKMFRIPEDKRMHSRYDEYLIQTLKLMSERMVGWSNKCKLCKDRSAKNQKLQPSVRTNAYLDQLSNHVKGKITGNRSTWSLFVSTLSWLYFAETFSEEDIKKYEK